MLGTHDPPIHLLLVEDSDADAALIEYAVRDSGFVGRLDIVASGQAAIDNLEGAVTDRGSLPDMVLLDLRLPDIDGLAVLAHVRRNEALTHLPIVVLTSSDDPADVLAAHRSHANAYVTKPLGLEPLRQAIDRLEGFWFSTAALPSSRAP